MNIMLTRIGIGNKGVGKLEKWINAGIAWVILIVIFTGVLALMGFFRRDNPFYTRKHSWVLLTLLVICISISYALKVAGEKGDITLVTLGSGILEMISLFIVPVILGVMFLDSSKHDTEVKTTSDKTKNVTTEHFKIVSRDGSYYEKIIVTEE